MGHATALLDSLQAKKLHEIKTNFGPEDRVRPSDLLFQDVAMISGLGHATDGSLDA